MDKPYTLKEIREIQTSISGGAHKAGEQEEQQKLQKQNKKD